MIEKGSFAGEQSHLQDCFVISPKGPSINPILEGNTLVKSYSDYEIKRPDLDLDIKRPNIKGNIDKYPQNIIVIQDNTTPNCPSNPPLEKLKWNKFSDIEKAKSIVRLPNLADSQPLSGKEQKGKSRIELCIA